MSRYLAANGKTYQNYAAALRIWADDEKKGAGTSCRTTHARKERAYERHISRND